MKNIKLVAGCAIFGFLLSFLIALSAHVAFTVALGRGVLAGIIFAALAFVLSFLLGNVLEIETTSFDSSQSGGGSAATESSTKEANIKIENEELPSESDDARFFVGHNHQMLMDYDTKKGESGSAKKPKTDEVKKNDSSVNPKPSFKPVGLDSITTKPSAPTPTEIVSGNDDVIDVLPDLETVGDVPLARTPSTETETITTSAFTGDVLTTSGGTDDSEGEKAESKPTDFGAFGENVVSSSELDDDDDSDIIDREDADNVSDDVGGYTDSSEDTYHAKHNESAFEGGDTALMAKAISTLLKRDEG